MRKTVAVLFVVLFCCCPGWAAEGKAATVFTLRSGKARLLLFQTPSKRFGVRILSTDPKSSVIFEQVKPLAIDVVGTEETETWLEDGYQAVTPRGGDLICTGAIRTAAGTRFRITDMYHALASGAFTMTRDVAIDTPGAADVGFNSRFSLAPRTATTMRDDDFFAPGVWYQQNAHVPPTALASQLDDRYFYFREDRLPLPLILTRDRRDGTTLTLLHLDGNPTTIAAEDGLARIVDARLQFGAIGVQNIDRPEPSFLFPGTEGERTYIQGGSRQGNRWAYRSHPVRTGVPHRYRLLIQLSTTPDFPAAVRGAWRMAYDLQKPPLIPVDLKKTYRDSMELLAAECHPYEGVPDLPFAAAVPDGKIVDTSSEMGFVGQALPAAAQVLRYGYETGNAEAIAHASDVISFWAASCTTPSGMPKTWYDIRPGGAVTWRNYHTFLRTASDGLNGTLLAWNTARQHGQDQPKWLTFCRAYGDFLMRAQNPEGSWAREYDFDGKPVNPSTNTTDQPIPFLVNLYFATGDTRYRDAALRAGEFCWKSVHLPYAYVGGTPDNPNVMDKESGMVALQAFLALYDVSQDRRWLTAASQAAWFSETWVYCWNIPIPTDDPQVVYPRGRTSYGLSLIATGHSGADDFMAAAPFDYYRLYLLTGETHFRDLARMLLLDTKQMLDGDGALHYKYPGLLTEVLGLPPLRGHGTTHWLPWLTVGILKPLIELQDTFGSLDIDTIEKLPLPERQRRAARYGRLHGFRSR